MKENYFQKIQSMSIDELAKFLSKISNDDSPWIIWFNENYCQKCEPIKGKYEDLDLKHEFTPCELDENRCGFTNADIPEIVKLWLIQIAPEQMEVVK